MNKGVGDRKKGERRQRRQERGGWDKEVRNSERGWEEWKWGRGHRKGMGKNGGKDEKDDEGGRRGKGKGKVGGMRNVRKGRGK